MQDLFGFEKIELKDEEKKYSRKVHSPIYTPRENGGVICMLATTIKNIFAFVA